MIKVVLGLSAAVLATVVAAKLTFDATTYTGAEPATQPWEQNTMEFVAWNGEKCCMVYRRTLDEFVIAD